MSSFIYKCSIFYKLILLLYKQISVIIAFKLLLIIKIYYVNVWNIKKLHE